LDIYAQQFLGFFQGVRFKWGLLQFMISSPEFAPILRNSLALLGFNFSALTIGWPTEK